MAKNLYDDLTKIIGQGQSINSFPEEERLREKIIPRKDDLWKIFLEYRKNPVVRNVIEGNLTFSEQLDDTLDGIVNDYHKNKIALSGCLGINFPYQPGVYVAGFGFLGAGILIFLARCLASKKPNADSNPGEVDHARRAFLIEWLPILAGGSIGGLAGYANYAMQRNDLSSRALYLDRVYQLVKS